MIKVAAVLLKHENKILIAKRNKEKSFGLMWEFPGGKVEKDETPQTCLVREMKEEFCIKINVEDYYDENIYKHNKGTIHLVVYWAKWISGEIDPTEHEEFKWVLQEDLHTYNFAPADIPIVERLRSEKDAFST